MNRRGDAGLTLIIGLVVGSLLLGNLLPSPFSWLNKQSQPNTQKSKYDNTEKTTVPKVAVFENGAVTVYPETREVHWSGTEEKTPKQTIGQKIAGFIASLSWWAILLGLFCVFVLGMSPIALLAGSRARYKQALSSTVSAIRSVDEETFNKLKPLLDAEHDRIDKQTIDKIKMNLH